MPAALPLQLYLASRSPRRQELLRQFGLRFEVLTADVEECRRPGERPEDYALRIAAAKARAGGRQAASDLPVLGADTDVVVDGEILGKPSGPDAALAMLRRLAGRRHQVYSAVAVCQRERLETALNVTEVEFASMTTAQMQAYCRTDEPLDKAGGYAIQGYAARFVRRISGSYSGVMGLPLYETAELLARFGLEVLPAEPAP